MGAVVLLAVVGGVCGVERVEVVKWLAFADTILMMSLWEAARMHAKHSDGGGKRRSLICYIPIPLNGDTYHIMKSLSFHGYRSSRPADARSSYFLVYQKTYVYLAW